MVFSSYDDLVVFFSSVGVILASMLVIQSLIKNQRVIAFHLYLDGKGRVVQELNATLCPTERL